MAYHGAVATVWPAREYAELFVNGEWSNYVPTEMPLEQAWLERAI